jgi:hypothetical protein
MIAAKHLDRSERASRRTTKGDRALRRRAVAGGLAALGVGLGCAAQPAAVPVESAPALVETAPRQPENAAPAGGASAASSAALPSVDPQNDTSLPLAVYRAAGVPEIEQPWSARDYERCLVVFVDLLRGGRSDLPRRGSQRSGALFARLVAVENFRSGDGAAPSERARRLQSYLEVYPGLLKVYSPANDGVDFSVEQAELIVSLFELLKSALESSRPIAAADPAWAPAYVRQQQMTLGVVRGARAMIAEPERYALPLREYLNAALARLAPALAQHLDAEAASEVLALAATDSETLR